MELPAYSGALSEGSYVGGLIESLEAVMNERNSKMEGSDWVFMGVGKMYVSFIRTTGRSIRNVREYVAYPSTKRGNSCVINLDYRRKPLGIVSQEPEAECLGWAVRCYKLYSKISNVEKQDGFIRDLTSTTGVFPRSY